MTAESRDAMNDILDSIAIIEEAIGGIGFEDYHTDRRLKILVVETFEKIFGLINSISEECKSIHPEIMWEEMSGLQKRFIHNDFGINEQEIWTASKRTLRKFKKQLIEMILADNK